MDILHIRGFCVGGSCTSGFIDKDVRSSEHCSVCIAINVSRKAHHDVWEDTISSNALLLQSSFYSLLWSLSTEALALTVVGFSPLLKYSVVFSLYVLFF